MKEPRASKVERSGVKRQDPRQSRSLFRRIGLALVLLAVSFAYVLRVRAVPRGSLLNAQTGEDSGRAETKQEERQEFRSYVWGIGLALLLTVVPFALVHWLPGIPRVTLFFVIGAFALVQMLVHFRFFLHIGFKQKREDLQLLVFSALLLMIMVGGTIWIMTSLALRMALPGSL